MPSLLLPALMYFKDSALLSLVSSILTMVIVLDILCTT